ncbi:MAG: HAMP domain-containing histidine kinase [Lachnospiraceae bacterium]|jgi:signal transduction histidine kinase|nr:HAMP domain-containing histidine kinase [Lachnospiraceae bacterium]
MNGGAVLFFQCLIICVLLGIILYQQWIFRTGTQRKIRVIHKKLQEIIASDSSESIMVFTDNQELQELAAQINDILEHHRKAKADYNRSEMASKKMLSNISHDMKTPMTVILGYLEIMRLNGKATTEMLAKTEEKAESLMELINQFFTLAKIEAGDMDLELSRIDICEICRESILDFYEILTKADFQVDVRLPESAVYIQGNREALERILLNLISNVIRYGSEGKYLGLLLRTEEKYVCIDVVDKGKGIEKAFAEHVFDRLFTLEDSRSRSVQGNGLGLAIAKNLALQLGGELSLESIPYEKTVFTVKLKNSCERNL